VDKRRHAALSLSQRGRGSEVFSIGLLDSLDQGLFKLFFMLQLSLQVCTLPAAQTQAVAGCETSTNEPDELTILLGALAAQQHSLFRGLTVQRVKLWCSWKQQQVGVSALCRHDCSCHCQ